MLAARILTAIALALAPTGLASALTATPQDASAKLRNADFERGRTGERPPGWAILGGGATAVLTDKRVKQGKLSLQLSSAGFGNAMQTLDAKTYRGKHVRLRASVRARGRAQLWLRVDRPGKERGFFDNMADRPITKRAWDSYEVTGKVADDATYIAVGMMLIGGGQAWLDEVSLQIVDAKDLPKIQGPRAFTGRGLQNVTALVRLLGYVRYFHPADQAQNVDWDQLAIAGLRNIEGASSPEELAAKLQKIFHKVAPTVRVAAGDKAPSLPEELTAPQEGARMMAWHHQGIGHNRQTSGIYRSRRRRARELDEHARPDQPYVARLPGGVTCMVPLTLYVQKRSDRKPPPPKRSRLTLEDRAVRLAAIAKAWNVFQHFYPYHDVVKTDWNAALQDALSEMATAKDDRTAIVAMRRMVARLRDGHGYVSHMQDGSFGYLPVRFGWVEDELVLMAVDRIEGLQPGMIVKALDDQSAAQALAAREALCSSATPWFRRYRALQQLQRGKRGDELSLTVVDAAGKEKSVIVRYGSFRRGLLERRPTKIHEIRKGVWYIDIQSVDDKDLRAAQDNLAKARGIIYDFRGYPGNIKNPHGLFGHMLKERGQSPQWLVPEIRFPDRKNMKFKKTGRWRLQPLEPHFAGKRVFLIDARAISYAESCMGIVEAYKLGEIVGPEPTAGTNGNVNPFSTPGGFQISWTGMRVLKHDGSHHHGVGIAPTVKVKPTLAGVRAGKDEVLDKALQLLK